MVLADQVVNKSVGGSPYVANDGPQWAPCLMYFSEPIQPGWSQAMWSQLFSDIIWNGKPLEQQCWVLHSMDHMVSLVRPWDGHSPIACGETVFQPCEGYSSFDHMLLISMSTFCSPHISTLKMAAALSSNCHITWLNNPKDGSSMVLQLPHHMAQQPRKPRFLSSLLWKPHILHWDGICYFSTKWSSFS